DQKGRRPELAFATDDLALAELAANDGSGVPRQERPGHVLERVADLSNRVLEEIRGGDRISLEPGLHDSLVCQGAGRAGDHALAACHARGASHRRVEVKGNPRPIALAHPADDVVLLDDVAAPYAAVAKNAGVVVHIDRK